METVEKNLTKNKTKWNGLYEQNHSQEVTQVYIKINIF